MIITLSEKAVQNMIEEQEDFDKNDIGFILTVLRDGCTDEEMIEKIEFFIGKI